MHVAEKMMFLTFVLVLLKIKGSVAGTSDGKLGSSPLSGITFCRSFLYFAEINFSYYGEKIGLHLCYLCCEKILEC
ncbi:Uncharacterised protein r2_g4194 [Pycnogonum litorale]